MPAASPEPEALPRGRSSQRSRRPEIRPFPVRDSVGALAPFNFHGCPAMARAFQPASLPPAPAPAEPGSPADDSAVTHDSLFTGAIRLDQPAPGHGYRANVDAILLAAFAARTGFPARVVLDLGSGVGTVALALHHLGAARTFA